MLGEADVERDQVRGTKTAPGGIRCCDDSPLAFDELMISEKTYESISFHEGKN